MNIDKIFQEFPKLETERLILRQINSQEDAVILFEKLYNVPEITKYDSNRIHEVGEGGFSMIQTMRSKIDLWNQMFGFNKTIVWGIELKSTGELIGIRYCDFYSHGVAYLECKLSKEYWRLGIMTEATNKIIDFLNFHDVRQFFTTINSENGPAIGLNKKLGFVETNLDEMYFSEDLQIGESIELEGLIQRISNHNELIFVLPQINPLAFKYFDEASEARTQQDLTNCVNYNFKALELQPDFIHAKNSIAWALLELGDIESALNYFNQILRVNSKKYSALLGRAYAYSDLGEIDKAIFDFESYLILDPSDDDTYTMLGNTYYLQNKFKEAINAYDNALKINPLNESAINNKNAILQLL